MSKSDYMLVSKHDIECMARVIVKLLDNSFFLTEIDELEDSIDSDVFEIVIKTFRDSKNNGKKK